MTFLAKASKPLKFIQKFAVSIADASIKVAFDKTTSELIIFANGAIAEVGQKVKA